MGATFSVGGMVETDNDPADAAQEGILERLAKRPIPHKNSYSWGLGSLRALRRRGLVELEYDDKGELVWRLVKP